MTLILSVVAFAGAARAAPQTAPGAAPKTAPPPAAPAQPPPPAAEPPAAPAPPPAAPAPAPAAGDRHEGHDHKALLEQFDARIDDIERKLAVAQSKVDVLRDTVLTDQVGATNVVILHSNQIGSAFVLQKATYVLDGGVIFNKEDRGGSLDSQKEFELFNGALTPGDHEIVVQMVYGASTLGLFTYLKGYKFKVDSKWHFAVVDGKQTKLSVVTFVKPDITQSTNEKIAVRYDLEVSSAPAKPAIEKPAIEKPASQKAAPAKQPSGALRLKRIGMAKGVAATRRPAARAHAAIAESAANRSVR